MEKMASNNQTSFVALPVRKHAQANKPPQQLKVTRSKARKGK